MKLEPYDVLRCFSLLTLFLLVSCQSTPKRLPEHVIDKKIPTLAVLEFNDKSQCRWRWNVGEGIRDTLIDELVQSQSYKVITRLDIDAVIYELKIQQDQLFRKEGKSDLGRLTNVQYLLKGSVTDFSYVASTGISAFYSKVGFSGRSHMAIVTVTLYIIEVETGEIIASKQVEGKAYASSLEAKGSYDNVSFGSGSFYRTPLGKACKKLMAEALDEINLVITNQKWNPRIVRLNENNRVIISGGKDRGLIPGMVYAGYYEGETLFDPETGDVLGQTEGYLAGQIELVEIKDKFSFAKIVEGQFELGQNLRQLLPENKK